MKNLIETHNLDELKEALLPFFAGKFHEFSPFHSELLHFCEALSQALFQHEASKEYPDFIALAFWLRKSHLYQLQQSFMQRVSSQRLLVPRGVVFHLPPANIDVMLVYSWISSLLVGNGNIIRIPSSRTIRAQKLLNIILELLSENRFLSISQMTCFIQYGHEESLTAWISARVDLRIIWGGDETIVNIRKIPLQAHAKDLAFPDRFSFGAIHAEMYLQLNPEERMQIATNFFNDIYWFDQSACSSPRLLFWVGEASSIHNASQAFYQALQQVIEQRHYEVSLGGALLKQTYMYDQALTLPVEAVYQLSNELSVLVLKRADERCRHHCGQGLLYHVPVMNLEEIVPFVTHRDQTLSYYGFDANVICKLAREVNGRGLTRIVPIGQALNFDPIWDGQDLFTEFTATTQVIL